MRTESENLWSAWTLLVCLFLGALILLFASMAQAQTANPSKVAWDYPTAEHATLTKYVFGFYLPGGTDPVQLVDILPSAATPIANGYEAAMPRPVVGTYIARLRACIDTTCSDWSNATDPFLLTPRVPANLRPVQ